MQSRIVNEREYRIVGLSRSGNHAVIQWIRGQLPGRVCFLNCVEPRTNPYQTARPMDGDRRAAATYDGFSLDQEARGKLTPKDVLIYSYEDCFLSTVCHREFESRHDQFLGPSRHRTDLLILRDPFNLFASRIQSRFGGVTPRTAIRIWKQHARQFRGERSYTVQPFVPINFNCWAGNRAYRRQLARRLELSFSDEGVHSVPATGGGSSFDGRAFHGHARKMDVFGRWRYFQDDHEYRALFDEELLRLSDAIFGWIEDSADFRRFRLSLTR